LSSLLTAAGGIAEGAYEMKAADVMNDELKNAESNQRLDLEMYHRALDFTHDLKVRYGGRLEDAYQDLSRITRDQQGPDAMNTGSGGSVMPGGGGQEVSDLRGGLREYNTERATAMYGFASERFNMAQGQENTQRAGVTGSIQELDQILAARGAALAHRQLGEGKMIENSTVLGWKILEMVAGGVAGAMSSGTVGEFAADTTTSAAPTAAAGGYPAGAGLSSPAVQNGSIGAGNIGGGMSAEVTGGGWEGFFHGAKQMYDATNGGRTQQPVARQKQDSPSTTTTAPTAWERLLGGY